MRYSAEHKDQTRSRIMEAAARVFREGGYGGAGIDGLTKAAGVTNGAFYGHFKTKAEAFRAALMAGLQDVRHTIGAYRAQFGPDWRAAFVRFYLGPRHAAPLGEACALPTLSPDVMRADADTRAVFTSELQAVLDAMADGMPQADAPAREAAAIGLLAQLVGGALLARSVGDPELERRITEAVTIQAEG